MSNTENILNMENEAEAKTVGLVIYLASCVMNQTTPEIPQPDEKTLEAVYECAGRHMVGAIVADGLEKAGYGDPHSAKEIGRSLRRSILFDAAWKEVCEKYDAAGIHYLPLKGVVIQQYYPRPELREMSDHDILIDPARAEDVKDIMESLDYTTDSFGIMNHDVYMKAPLLNFEIHRELFSQTAGKEIYDYYLDVDRFLSGEGCLQTMSPEDFYIYMVAHEFKHFNTKGTGLRSLLDTYIFLKKENLDWEYVNGEIGKLGISDFEQLNRTLAMNLFSEEKLSDAEAKMLKYVVSSGVYGNKDYKVENLAYKMGDSKARYMAHRFLVPVSPKNKDYIRFANSYPTFYKYKILLPLLPFYRVIVGLKNGRLSKEMNVLKKVLKR